MAPQCGGSLKALSLLLWTNLLSITNGRRWSDFLGITDVRCFFICLRISVTLDSMEQKRVHPLNPETKFRHISFYHDVGE